MLLESTKKKLRIILCVAVCSVFAIGSLAFAGKSKGKFYPPDQVGPYSIGHTTVILTDTSRNLDGSTPVNSDGRFLYLDIWYPTTEKTTEHVYYTWNNPLYNENPNGLVYPGLPDLPPLTWGSRSLNPVLDEARLAQNGKFPLLVASHGNIVSSAKNMPDTLETLASHGYVVASVEHTGNNDAYYQTSVLKTWAGNLDLGPNPDISANGTILQRTKDVSFVIDSVLDGMVDQETDIAFSEQIDAEKIGVLGFSLGGQTSLAMVTGISSAGHPADRRVKAALMGGGSNWGSLLGSADFVNASVPLMFIGNDMGYVYDSFNQFTGSNPKYLVDIADYNHHIGGYESSWCQDFQNSMEVVNPDVFPMVFIAPSSLDPSDIANWVFDATFYFTYTGPRQSGVYDYCEPSVFDNISDEQLVDVMFGDPQILEVRDELIGLMPLKPEASIEETTRLTNWYAVSFFNKILKNQNAYSRYLANSTANQRRNPLGVRMADNCRNDSKPSPTPA